jgi:hypothetical protein
VPALSILTADERALAQRYKLKEYVEQNENYLLFVLEVKKCICRTFKGLGNIDWAKNKFAEIVQIFLERNDELFEHVNNIHADQAEFRNIPSKDWIHMCNISSKILVEMVWNSDKKS